MRWMDAIVTTGHCSVNVDDVSMAQGKGKGMGMGMGAMGVVLVGNSSTTWTRAGFNDERDIRRERENNNKRPHRISI